MTRDESPTWQEDEYEWHSNFFKKSPNSNKTQIEIIKKKTRVRIELARNKRQRDIKLT
jgi:hypothetical protein